MASDVSKFLQRVKLRASLLCVVRALPGLGFAAALLSLSLWWWGASFWHLSLLLFSLLFVGGVALWIRWLRETSLSEMAQRVEGDTGLFTRGYLVASLEFSSSSRFTQPFAKAVTEQTSAILRQVSPSEISPLWPLPASFHMSVLLIASFIGFLWLTPRQALFTPAAAVMAAPVVGDLVVRYEYPKYSKMAPRQIEGLSGVISALKGTRVSLQTRALRPVTAAKIVIDGSDKQIPLKVDGERELSGEFTLLESGSFRFVIQEASGEWVAGPFQEMKAETDLTPVVELISPSGDLEVKELDQLELEVAVEDDFAIRSLRIVFEIDGISTPQTIEVTSFTDRKRSFRGVLKQPLESLHLKEGDRVRYFVEALDNDVVSGPKRGASKPRFLKIFSAKENHQRLIEEQAELVHLLAAHLGARMEEPFPIVFAEDAPVEVKEGEALRVANHFSALSLGAEKLVSVMDGIALSLTDDALSHPEVKATLHEIAGRLTEQANDDLEHIKSLRASSKKSEPGPLQSAKTHNQKIVTILEGDLYSLDEMVKRQRAENVRNIAEELAAAKERLKALIEEYEKTKDPKLKEQIQREIERLEALLKTYQEELAKMQEEMPEEFFNLEALKPDEMEDNLSKAKESIAKGDMSAAKAALSQLSEALDSDQQKLDDEAARFGDAEQQKRDKEAEQLINDLSLLESEEKRLLQATQEIEGKARAAAEAANKPSIDVARSAAREELNRLSEGLASIDADALSDAALLSHASSVDRVEELDAALSTKALAEVISSATSLSESLLSYQRKLAEQLLEEEQRNDIYGRLSSLRESETKLASANKSAAEIVALLQKATPELNAYLGEAEAVTLLELQKAQRENHDKLAPLQEKMKKLSAVFGGGSAAPVAPGAAAPPPQDLPAEVKVLLKDAKQAMSDASSSLGRKQPTPSIGFERTALQKLQELKQLIKSAGKKNQTQKNSQKVKIPTAEEFEPPRDYRDEVIEGSKEKDRASPKYQEALKKYYQELLQ